MRVVRLEERDSSPGLHDRVDFADHRLHIALMGFVRAIYVEKLQPRPLRWYRSPAHHVIDDPAIAEVLAPSIGIERAQHGESNWALIVAEASAAIAVGRRGRSIDEACAVR